METRPKLPGKRDDASPSMVTDSQRFPTTHPSNASSVDIEIGENNSQNAAAAAALRQQLMSLPMLRMYLPPTPPPPPTPPLAMRMLDSIKGVMQAMFTKMSYLMGIMWKMLIIIIVTLCAAFKEIFTVRNLWLTNEGLGCIIAPVFLILLSIYNSIFTPEEDFNQYDSMMRFILLYGWQTFAIPLFYCVVFKYRNYDPAAAIIAMLSRLPIFLVGQVMQGYFVIFTRWFFRAN